MDIIRKLVDKKYNEINIHREYDILKLLRDEIVFISFDNNYNIVFFLIDNEKCKHIPLAILNHKKIDNKIAYDDIEIFHPIFKNIRVINGPFTFDTNISDTNMSVIVMTLMFRGLHPDLGLDTPIEIRKYRNNDNISIRVDYNPIKNSIYVKKKDNNIDKILADRLQYIDSELKNILIKLKQEMLNDVIDFLNAKDEEFNNKK